MTNPMTILGAACAAVAVVNCLAAVFYAWRSNLAPAWICLVNFALLGGMVQIGVFG